jgi:hypothetical protein
MTGTDEFEEYLKEQDSLSLPFRVERLKFLVKNFGEPRHMALPQMAYYYIEEAKLCYLNGAFVACVQIVQSALEDILRNFYFIVPHGHKSVEYNFTDLIDGSLNRGAISNEEATSMHEIRQLRNPYVHTKDMLHPKGFLMRCKESNFEKDEWDLMKEDAEKAIVCLFNFIKRFPFSVYGDENDI